VGRTILGERANDGDAAAAKGSMRNVNVTLSIHRLCEEVKDSPIVPHVIPSVRAPRHNVIAYEVDGAPVVAEPVSYFVESALGHVENSQVRKSFIAQMIDEYGRAAANVNHRSIW